MLVGKKKAYEVKFMSIFNLLSMIGGLSLFLYGMSAMGDGLAKMAGGKLEAILEKLTSKKIFAVLLGAGVTAVIQSSSATTVMVVGFVNSGIMKLSQAVGIIMGANVGTTVTSWCGPTCGRCPFCKLVYQIFKPGAGYAGRCSAHSHYPELISICWYLTGTLFYWGGELFSSPSYHNGTEHRNLYYINYFILWCQEKCQEGSGNPFVL